MEEVGSKSKGSVQQEASMNEVFRSTYLRYITYRYVHVTAFRSISIHSMNQNSKPEEIRWNFGHQFLQVSRFSATGCASSLKIEKIVLESLASVQIVSAGLRLRAENRPVCSKNKSAENLSVKSVVNVDPSTFGSKYCVTRLTLRAGLNG